MNESVIAGFNLYEVGNTTTKIERHPESAIDRVIVRLITSPRYFSGYQISSEDQNLIAIDQSGRSKTIDPKSVMPERIDRLMMTERLMAAVAATPPMFLLTG